MLKLSVIREKCGLTQEQLANTVGLAPSTIANYECGKRKPDVFKAAEIAKALSCSIDELMGKEKDHSEEWSVAELSTRLESYSLSALREIRALADYLIYRKEREQAQGQASADKQ